MADRGDIERLLGRLYAARVDGDLQGLLATFAPRAKFEIAGAGQTNTISLIAVGHDEIRTWLAIMTKTFRLNDHETLAMLIDGDRAAVHWRARIHSKITGKTVLTEFVDVVGIGDGRIQSFTEFFAPR